jgi:hypothetical protein
LRGPGPGGRAPGGRGGTLAVTGSGHSALVRWRLQRAACRAWPRALPVPSWPPSRPPSPARAGIAPVGRVDRRGQSRRAIESSRYLPWVSCTRRTYGPRVRCGRNFTALGRKHRPPVLVGSEGLQGNRFQGDGPLRQQEAVCHVGPHEGSHRYERHTPSRLFRWVCPAVVHDPYGARQLGAYRALVRDFARDGAPSRCARVACPSLTKDLAVRPQDTVERATTCYCIESLTG